MRRVTRRRALAEALGATGAGTLALALTGCAGHGEAGTPAATGSTLQSTWGDPVGDAQLRVGAGEPFVVRLELGPGAPATATLTTLAQITDAHVLDASSPARVGFLDRLGAPFQSTFRPQETLTTQVLAGTAAAVRALAPNLVIQGGDLIDNAQSNELTHSLAALAGGVVAPGSGRAGYFGVQSAADTDPFYYRPDVDAPLHPGLLKAAVRPFHSPGIGAPAYPVLGDHDALVAGEIVPTELTRALAVGDQALWDLPRGLTLPPGARAQASTSPDGPPDPGLVDPFLRRALAGPTVSVPADPERRELSFDEVLARLRAAAPPAAAARGAAPRVTAARGAAPHVTAPRDTGRLDYVLDAGPRVRVIVLDLVRREGGSGGLVAPTQLGWLASQLRDAGDRWVLVVSHQPLQSSAGGEALLALLDRAPRVIAALSGHTHRNRIRARPTPAGGYWLISTASLIDYPQQSRALRIHEITGGGVAIATWMLDHVFPGRLGTISRQLSYIDAQGGRPQDFGGTRADRNAILYRRAPG